MKDGFNTLLNNFENDINHKIDSRGGLFKGNSTNSYIDPSPLVKDIKDSINNKLCNVNEYFMNCLTNLHKSKNRI